MQILLEFCKQITSAMNYLEKKFLIHRNLSCRNFLVFNKSLVSLNFVNMIQFIIVIYVQIKLSELDFGHLNPSWKDRLTLPIAWMSPEAINCYRFTTASDVFSFGISMWECFAYGEVPWAGMTNDEVRFKLYLKRRFET
jgi:serine/threonine protein kinase